VTPRDPKFPQLDRLFEEYGEDNRSGENNRTIEHYNGRRLWGRPRRVPRERMRLDELFPKDE
jgi:hypothetical protein